MLPVNYLGVTGYVHDATKEAEKKVMSTCIILKMLYPYRLFPRREIDHRKASL